MKTLLCIDPGETVGVCVLTYDSKTPAVVVNVRELAGTPSELQALFLNYAGTQDVTVIIEDWDWGNPGVDPRATVECIGMVRQLAHPPGWPIVRQPPLFRTAIGDTPEKLRGYWMPNLKAHDDRRQALRHGLSYLVNTKFHLPTTQALFPR